MVYETEEEQLDAIRHWWAENGRAVVVGVVLAVAVAFGWRAWVGHQRAQADGASMAYQMLLQQLNAGETQQVSELGRQIIGQYPTTVYAVLTALTMAQQAVDRADLDGAAAQLQWAMEHSKVPELKQLAQVRLARVLVAQGKPEQALQQLNTGMASFDAMVEEVKGDAYLALGKRADAYRAYSKALSGYAEVPEKQQLLRMKLDDLADAGTPEK